MIMNTTQKETSINPRELHRRLAAGLPARLLDVRTPGEYEAAHVPGAELIPLDELDAADFCREHGIMTRRSTCCASLAGGRKRRLKSWNARGFAVVCSSKVERRRGSTPGCR